MQHFHVCWQYHKLYPNFISCDHTGQTFSAIWLKEIERVSGNVNPDYFLNVCQFVRYPPCSELSHIKVAMENLTSSTQRECKLWRLFPIIVQIRGSALTLSTTGDIFLCALFETVFRQLPGVTVFLSLSSGQNKACHLLMVACEEAMDTTTVTTSLWIFSVLSPSLSRAKKNKQKKQTKQAWKRSLCLLKCSILTQSANGWFKRRHINQWRVTRITYWLELVADERWHFLHMYYTLHNVA